MRIILLLIFAAALCGCRRADEAVLKLPPAPWNDYYLWIENVHGNGGGAAPMEVYRGSVKTGGFSSSDGCNAQDCFRVTLITDAGILLDVSTEGSRDKASIHLRKTVFVPYNREITIPVMGDLVYKIHFYPKSGQP